MKRVLIVMVFWMSMVTMSMGSIIPTESLVLIKTNEIEVSLIDEVQKDFFKMATYSESSSSFDFVTREETKFIQIFDSRGDLLYQLPVLSRKVRISKQLFGKGEYKLGFMIDGNKKVEFTGVKVK
ncbi:MAG: hypothetical protein HKN09_10215 [Saprospiraceae bacterium]|nr:hypothetical protein [Saprospiraceae bacterium]